MIKKIIRFILCLFAAVLVTLTTLGYLQYKNAVQAVSIEEKVAMIQAADDYVTLDEVSIYLKEATVAIEDRRFYDHHGVDFVAWLRIFKDLIFTQSITGGGSTISQQLAKNMYFGYEPSLIRKFSELFVVHELEKNYDKDTLLELYINIINYGDNYIGINQASQGYYGIAPKDLNLDQASTLAGIPQSPAYLQLSNQSMKTIVRQQAVLEAMVREGMINETMLEEIMVGKGI